MLTHFWIYFKNNLSTAGIIAFWGRSTYTLTYETQCTTISFVTISKLSDKPNTEEGRFLILQNVWISPKEYLFGDLFIRSKRKSETNKQKKTKIKQKVKEKIKQKRKNSWRKDEGQSRNIVPKFNTTLNVEHSDTNCRVAFLLTAILSRVAFLKYFHYSAWRHPCCADLWNPPLPRPEILYEAQSKQLNVPDVIRNRKRLQDQHRAD
jgi:hypothetical protein